MRQKKLFLATGIFTLFTLALAMPLAAASSYKIIHEFRWAKNPTGNLVRDAAGNLYGTTYDGPGSGCGGSGCGTVWRLKPNSNGTWTASTLHVFTGADGANPTGGLILDAAGNLYGTTVDGGATSFGTVFQLRPNSNGTWTERVLYSFSDTGAAGDYFPGAGLFSDSAGDLYGTTFGLHPYSCGAVFKLKPNAKGTWTYSVLYSFGCGSDGAFPVARLIVDSSGNVYGTTLAGGIVATNCNNYGCGVAFKLKPNADGTWGYSVLYSFEGGSDGGSPAAGLIFDAAGNLYGTTAFGGQTSCPGVLSCGVVFNLVPNKDGTWTENVLHSFTGADGAVPEAGLLFDAAGNLYGTTYNSGSCAASSVGCGVVFKLTRSSGWSETVLRTFLGDGCNPAALVILDPAGNLFGTTRQGSANFGLVFEITP